MYPNEWKGNSDNLEGISIVKIDGVEYSLGLKSFEDHQMLNMMLDMAFDQGKIFGSEVMKSNVIKSIDHAERAHNLTKLT